MNILSSAACFWLGNMFNAINGPVLEVYVAIVGEVGSTPWVVLKVFMLPLLTPRGLGKNG